VEFSATGNPSGGDHHAEGSVLLRVDASSWIFRPSTSACEEAQEAKHCVIAENAFAVVVHAIDASQWIPGDGGRRLQTTAAPRHPVR
jgi:hypothetical protein